MNSIARYFKCMMPRSSRRCILCPTLPEDIWYKILSEIFLPKYPQIIFVNSMFHNIYKEVVKVYKIRYDLSRIMSGMGGIAYSN